MASTRKRVRRAFQRFSAWLPGPLVRVIRDSPLGRILPRTEPVLSVVVPVYNVEDYLGECLDSVLAQTLQRMQIILVDDGSTDGSAAIMAEYAARDRRIVIVRQANAGLGAARNAGITAARAPYLTFLDADDTVPPDAYQQMVRTLSRTGSDFAIGAVRRMRHGHRSVPSWTKNVHQVERLRVTIDQFPDAMQDVIACNRMFRTEFWRTKIGPFEEGTAYEDHVPMVTAYLRAHAFDVLTTFTYNWRIRENATSIGQQKHLASNLEDRLRVKQQALDVVMREASSEVRAAWLGRVADTDLPVFIPYALAADDDYRAVLQRAAAAFLAHFDDAALRHARPSRKISVALVAAGRWDEVDRLLEFTRLNSMQAASTVVGGRIFADLDFGRDLALRPEMYEYSDHQSAYQAVVRGIHWQADRSLQIDGWAFIGGVDLTELKPDLRFVLRRLDGSGELELTHRRRETPAATAWANQPNHRYDQGGFVLTVPVSRIVTAGPSRWQLRVRIEADGVVREGPVLQLVRTGIGDRMPSSPTISPLDDTRVVPLLDSSDGFVLTVQHGPIRANRLEVTQTGELVGSLSVLQPLPSPPTRAVLLEKENRSVCVTTPLQRDAAGQYGFRLTPPAGKGSWELRVVTESGEQHRVMWPVEAVTGRTVADRRGRLLWQRTPRGLVQAARPGRSVQATAVHLDADRLSLEVQTAGLNAAALRQAELRGDAATVRAGTVEPLGPQRWRLTFPTRIHYWNAAEPRPLVSGVYGIAIPGRRAAQSALPTVTFGEPQHDEVDDSENPDARPGRSGALITENPGADEAVIDDELHGDAREVGDRLGPGHEIWVRAGDDLLLDLPDDQLTSSHHLTVARRTRSTRLVLTVRPPLAVEERGRVSQRRLGQWYRQTTFEPADQVLFQCYRGEFATDSQLAIHQELWRRETPLELVWGVSDYSVELPAGARPVIIGSRAWYEAIGRSRYLCNNIDFDRFFDRRDYQRFLQTFHGYPFKSMGISFWRTKDFTEQLIEFECRRRNEAWTSIVVPADFCEEIYRREYRYAGEVLVTGYPRDDALVAPAAGTRERVLQRLAVPADKTVLLYAPTWRESDATGAWAARLFDELDLDRLSAALGDDYVVLLRGHNYNLRDSSPQSRHSARIIDVTRYPEINDLTIAADAAILDYSSLRFDWLITDKPMLFFVPDLEDYLASRTALFDFAPTAPGPMLQTTDEVIAAVRELEAVSAEFAEARRDCNTRFNSLNDGRATARVVDAFFDQGGRR
ncbi:putative glycosyltransferase/ glycerophosphotransferase [Microlunatus phosphovorus NM-1]|uniref:Putative glycosyltransferase/ glycerophosphotransferase n=1 Tax=Microlunatus phosphovorus (strain ATCC 700054 / DSM 10555 / JCM 9379 / NBRC 101784 / NCIMB 13414 / VKM Ac-1990 / NM-1) TaxID=1032480 RepID=F5XGW3_MICPN|nr:CDP-glycerol glycerophosphotransferase family protein [Microlunatus phosphovorus]BAK35595.1 putative glycosyltransferase/ glycerophosphotransferase [Microlunatus phosphovorus NM-1]